MYRLSIAYVSSLAVFLIVDGLIIFTFGAKLYRQTLKDVIADSFHVPPIVLFYLLFAFGLCYFSVAPALQDGRWQTSWQISRIQLPRVRDSYHGLPLPHQGH